MSVGSKPHHFVDWFKFHKAMSAYEKGKRYAEQNDPESAVKQFTHALSRYNEPELQSDIHSARAASYKSLGKDGYAIQDYNQAIIYNPFAFTSYFERGKLLAKMGNYQAAIADFDSAIRVGSKSGANPTILNNYYCERGIAHMYLGDYEKASKDLRETTKCDPNHLTAHYYLSLVYSALKNHVAALKEINEIFNNPQIMLRETLSPAYFYVRGHEYSKKENHLWREAFNDFDHASRMQAKTEDDNLVIALANYKLGRCFDEGRGVDKNPLRGQLHYTYAKTYFENHQYEKWAIYTLAKMYEHGYGVIQDKLRATNMLKSLASREKSPAISPLIKAHLDALDNYFVKVPFYTPGINPLPAAIPSYYSNGNSSLLYNNNAQHAGNGRNNIIADLFHKQSHSLR